MTNFKLVSSDTAAGRTEFHDALGLTGSEVSINAFPAGAAVPFVHAHTKNEEFYYVIEGKGELWIDGEVVAIKAGDAFRIAPAGKRAIRAAEDSALRLLCTQSREGSLEGFTMTDAVICEEKAPWHK